MSFSFDNNDIDKAEPLKKLKKKTRKKTCF